MGSIPISSTKNALETVPFLWGCKVSTGQESNTDSTLDDQRKRHKKVNANDEVFAQAA